MSFELQQHDQLLNQNEFVSKKEYNELVDEFSKLKNFTQDLQQQLTCEIQKHDEQLKKQQNLWESFIGNLNGLVSMESQNPLDSTDNFDETKSTHDIFVEQMNSLTKFKSAEKENNVDTIQEIKSQLDELKLKVNSHSNLWVQFKANCQSLMNQDNQSANSHTFADDIRSLAHNKGGIEEDSTSQRLSKLEKQSELQDLLWERFARNMDIFSHSNNENSELEQKSQNEFINQIKLLLQNNDIPNTNLETQLDYLENKANSHSLLWKTFIENLDILISDNDNHQSSKNENPSQEHLKEFINEMKEMIPSTNEIKKEVQNLHQALHDPPQNNKNDSPENENQPNMDSMVSDTQSEKFDSETSNRWTAQIQNITSLYTPDVNHDNQEDSYLSAQSEEPEFSECSSTCRPDDERRVKMQHPSLKSMEDQIFKLQNSMKCVKYELKNCKFQLFGHNPIKERNIASNEDIDLLKESISNLNNKYEAMQTTLDSQSKLWDQFDQSLRQLLNVAFAEMDFPTNSDFVVIQDNIKCLKHEMKKVIEDKKNRIIEDQMQRQAYEQVIKDELLPLAMEVSKLHSVCAKLNNNEDEQDPEDLQTSIVNMKEEIKALKGQFNSMSKSEPNPNLNEFKELKQTNRCLKYEIKHLKQAISSNSIIQERSINLDVIDDDTTHKLLDKISKLEKMNAQVLKNTNELKRLKSQITSLEDIIPTIQTSESSNNQQIVNELVIDVRDLKEEVSTISQKYQKNYQFSDVSSNSSIGSNQLNQVSAKGSTIPDSTKISILAKEIKKLRNEQEHQSQLIQSLKQASNEPLNRPSTPSNETSAKPSVPSLSSLSSSNNGVERASFSPVKSSQYLMHRDEGDFEKLNSKIVALELGYQHLLQNTQSMKHSRTNSTSSLSSNGGPLSPGRAPTNEYDDIKKYILTFKKQIKALDSTIGEIKQQQAQFVKKDELNAEISQIQLDWTDMKEGMDALKLEQARLKKQTTSQPHTSRNTTPLQSDAEMDEKQKEIEKLKVSIAELQRNVAQMPASLKKNLLMKLNLDLEKMKTDILQYVDSKIAGDTDDKKKKK